MPAWSRSVTRRVTVSVGKVTAFGSGVMAMVASVPATVAVAVRRLLSSLSSGRRSAGSSDDVEDQRSPSASSD